LPKRLMGCCCWADTELCAICISSSFHASFSCVPKANYVYPLLTLLLAFFLIC
jgi:hypothetical protein